MGEYCSNEQIRKWKCICPDIVEEKRKKNKVLRGVCEEYPFFGTEAPCGLGKVDGEISFYKDGSVAFKLLPTTNFVKCGKEPIFVGIEDVLNLSIDRKAKLVSDLKNWWSEFKDKFRLDELKVEFYICNEPSSFNTEFYSDVGVLNIKGSNFPTYIQTKISIVFSAIHKNYHALLIKVSMFNPYFGLSSIATYSPTGLAKVVITEDNTIRIISDKTMTYVNTVEDFIKATKTNVNAGIEREFEYYAKFLGFKPKELIDYSKKIYPNHIRAFYSIINDGNFGQYICDFIELLFGSVLRVGSMYKIYP